MYVILYYNGGKWVKRTCFCGKRLNNVLNARAGHRRHHKFVS